MRNERVSICENITITNKTFIYWHIFWSFNSIKVQILKICQQFSGLQLLEHTMFYNKWNCDLKNRSRYENTASEITCLLASLIRKVRWNYCFQNIRRQSYICFSSNNNFKGVFTVNMKQVSLLKRFATSHGQNLRTKFGFGILEELGTYIIQFFSNITMLCQRFFQIT